MKRSELRQIIREEVESLFKEDSSDLIPSALKELQNSFIGAWNLMMTLDREIPISYPIRQEWKIFKRSFIKTRQALYRTLTLAGKMGGKR